jgi:hypothetical protein
MKVYAVVYDSLDHDADGNAVYSEDEPAHILCNGAGPGIYATEAKAAKVLALLAEAHDHVNYHILEIEV